MLPTVRDDLPQRLRTLLAERTATVQVIIEGSTAPGDAELLLSLLGEDVSDIRQLPIAAQQALAALSHPDVSTGQLTKLFRMDPALSQSLLRTANSAYYRAESEIVSIPHAIERIGFGGVRGVLMVDAVERMLCRPGPTYEGMLGQVWAHMVRTAPAARSIAISFGAEPEHMFVLGLLHDAGKLAIFDRLAQLRTDLRREAKVPAPLLRAVLMEMHEPLGGLAALQWGLGANAARAIATHHRRDVKGPDPEAETLFLAERLDLCSQRHDTMDAKKWLAEGRITGPVAQLLASSASPETLLLV